MNEQNLKKILIALIHNDEVTLEYARDELKIDNNEVIFIFNYLKEMDVVINTTTKMGIAIGTKRDFDYLSLSESLVNKDINNEIINPETTPNKKISIGDKWMIILTIVVIISMFLIAYFQGIFDKLWQK